MSYSTLGGTRGLVRRGYSPVPKPSSKPIPVRAPSKLPVTRPFAWRPVKVPFVAMNGVGLQGIGVDGRGEPTLPQLAKFLENYKGYVLAFSPATNSVVAYPQGMQQVAFSIALTRGEPTDAGLSRARARIDGPGSLNGLGNIFNQRAQLQARGSFSHFNPHTAWGGKSTTTTRSGNGLRREAPFYAGVSGVTPIVVDPPIDQQEVRWDTPSMTLYIGTNKVALVPALLSALAVKVILMGGSKVATASKFWSAADKAERKLSRG